MPDFEVFKKRTPPPQADAYVTVQKKGTLGFNRAAYEKLGRPKAIELLYDPAEKIIGLRGADEASEHAYPIRSAALKRDSSFLVSGTAFCNYYGIDITSARRWHAYEDGDILCVDLKKPFTEVTSNRNRKATRSDASESDIEGEEEDHEAI
jgi:hypothetical protein